MDLALYLETPRMGHRQVNELTTPMLAKDLKLSALPEKCDEWNLLNLLYKSFHFTFQNLSQ